MESISSSSYWDLVYPVVTVHSSASATITVAGKTFTSDASGNTQHSMPWGTFSISDSVSGQSFECTIGRDTTDAYVMPEGALFWHGNLCLDKTGRWDTATCTNDATIANVRENLTYTGSTFYGKLTTYKSIKFRITSNKINITKYNTLNVLADLKNTNYSGIIIQIKSILDGNPTLGRVSASWKGDGETMSKDILSLDLSKNDGDYYVSAHLEARSGSGGTGTELTVYEIWLE